MKAVPRELVIKEIDRLVSELSPQRFKRVSDTAIRLVSLNGLTGDVHDLYVLAESNIRSMWEMQAAAAKSRGLAAKSAQQAAEAVGQVQEIEQAKQMDIASQIAAFEQAPEIQQRILAAQVGQASLGGNLMVWGGLAVVGWFVWRVVQK